RLCGLDLFGTDDFAGSAFGLDLGSGRCAEGMCAHRQFFGDLAVSENFYSVTAAFRQAPVAQRRFVHSGAVVECVEGLDIHRNVVRPVPRVVESAFGNAANERHLAAFETDADRAAGTGCLAFTPAAAGLAMAAGFALTQPLAAVFCPRTRSES